MSVELNVELNKDNETVEEEKADLSFLDNNFSIKYIERVDSINEELDNFISDVNIGLFNGDLDKNMVAKIIRDLFDGSFKSSKLIEENGFKIIDIDGNKFRLVP